MWIQVRSMDGRKTIRLDNLSKLTKIEELRNMLIQHFEADPERQRLFYRGKQLEDGHSLFDYDVGLNDLIQILIRSEMKESVGEGGEDGTSSEPMDTAEVVQTNGIESNSKEEATPEGAIWKVGDKCDAKDLNNGAWFEAVVTKVTKAETGKDQFIYTVKYDSYEEQASLESENIRPRARTILQWDQLHEGLKAMVNYNFDYPKEHGFWYDAEISKCDNSLRQKRLFCKILLGGSSEASEEVRIMLPEEVYQIEETPNTNGTVVGNHSNGEGEKEITRTQLKCRHCRDDDSKPCRFCGCYDCGGKHDPDKQLLCDECDMAFHLGCLKPPLTQVPEEEEWYCPECKNDESEVIKAGEGLRFNKKKSKMMSKLNDCKRDWGKGMACVGRTKVCTLVPSNHFGPIPGVAVGTQWKFRVQVSESGVHRPHVAGIHGRENEGAYSIVLSGGYEDDVDDGDEFSYTGSGGRDLSGNKRTAKQSSDQTLTHNNKALALNCNAPFNAKKGAESKEWKEGKPVRVVRNFKGRKHSDYCPEDGNRYDGIYKVAKYWPEQGQSGFLVWRYLLRRDDPTPAPWTPEGKKLVKKFGLKMQYPDGYLEAQEEKQSDEDAKGKGKKRKANTGSSPSISPAKKMKTPKYNLTKEQKDLISKDTLNAKVWKDILGRKEGSFLQIVEETFMCICCQEVVYQPVTATCGHSICKDCLQRSFKAEIYTCPNCRFNFGKEFAVVVNKPLQNILLNVFPGYEGGR